MRSPFVPFRRPEREFEGPVAWLFGRELEWEGAEPEERVMLPWPVPVYITYLTAMPTSSGIAYFEDVYSRDSAQLAASASDKEIAAAGR